MVKAFADMQPHFSTNPHGIAYEPYLIAKLTPQDPPTKSTNLVYEHYKLLLSLLTFLTDSTDF